MKPVIYYTLCRDWFGSRNYKVLGVTSEKRNQVFGRWVKDNEATHVTKDKLVGKFTTLEAAEGKIAAAQAVSEKYGPLIKANEIEHRRLYSEQEAAFRAIINE